jgi:catechol 2,3-dioxygenase-like lactoylglutathione lyase family enzyme
MKKRQGEPWMPAAEYGSSLPAFSINLLVRDIDASLPFYRDVLDATVHYADPDFAALRVGGAEMMLHADHTYDDHPWHDDLAAGKPRGLGAEIRLFGVDPDGVESRARTHGATVLKGATTKGHGWREVWVRDPDGYVWAVGIATTAEGR